MDKSDRPTSENLMYSCILEYLNSICYQHAFQLLVTLRNPRHQIFCVRAYKYIFVSTLVSNVHVNIFTFLHFELIQIQF